MLNADESFKFLSVSVSNFPTHNTKKTKETKPKLFHIEGSLVGQTLEKKHKFFVRYRSANYYWHGSNTFVLKHSKCTIVILTLRCT